MSKRALALALGVAATCALRAHGDESMPPWSDPGGIPVGADARSISPRKGDVYIHESPVLGAPRRGLSLPFVNLPIYAAINGTGCASRWIEIGPYAWVCGQNVDWSQSEATTAGEVLDAQALFYRYYFAGENGAMVYTRPNLDSATSRELETGWSIATLPGSQRNGWVQTPSGHWVSLRELAPARPSGFHGDVVDGTLRIGWVRTTQAAVYSSKPRKQKATLLRQARIDVVETEKVGATRWIRINDHDEWVRADDIAVPDLAPPPKELVSPRERWIDVNLANQTLVAYEGSSPVYATLVSSGRGTPGNVTPKGIFRIWVKIRSSTMDNAERDDVSRHYSMDEVPYVQFFSKDIALHGAYWHRDFGKKRSHGCVNLSPLDAKALFDFTLPSLPIAWRAVYPTMRDPASLVVVH